MFIKGIDEYKVPSTQLSFTYLFKYLLTSCLVQKLLSLRETECKHSRCLPTKNLALEGDGDTTRQVSKPVRKLVSEECHENSRIPV